MGRWDIKIRDNYKRVNTEKYIIDAGFDIETEGRKLQDYYFDLISKHCKKVWGFYNGLYSRSIH